MSDGDRLLPQQGQAPNVDLLGSGYLALTAVTALASVAVLLDRPDLPLGNVTKSLQLGSHCLWASGVAYLALTSVQSAVLGLRLRQHLALPPHSLTPAVIHGLVLLASVIALFRRYDSRVLLLGLDWLLPALAIVSTLALGLFGWLRWVIGRNRIPQEPEPSAAVRASRWPTVLLIVVCLVLISSVAYIELFDLPGSIQGTRIAD